MIARIVRFLDGLLKLNRATESLLIDIIASYSPWIAPLVPAYMTFHNMATQLAFPIWAAWAGAVCVETLGLSSIQTAVSFWQWNDSRQKADPQAPMILAVGTGAFYLATVLTVNAMLDGVPLLYRLAKALLSSLSVCAGVILALRAGHARRIMEAEKTHEERKAERAALRAARAAARDSRPAREAENPLSLPVHLPGNGRKAESIR